MLTNILNQWNIHSQIRKNPYPKAVIDSFIGRLNRQVDSTIDSKQSPIKHIGNVFYLNREVNTQHSH